MSKALSKDIWIDPSTFGTSQACKILAQMMNENVISIYEKHKVLSFINRMIHQFQGTAYIPIDAFPEVRIHVMELLKQDYLDKADKMPYPPKFISFLKNVIYYQHNFVGKCFKHQLYSWGKGTHSLYKKLDLKFEPEEIIKLLKDEVRLKQVHKKLKLKMFW